MGNVKFHTATVGEYLTYCRAVDIFISALDFRTYVNLMGKGKIVSIVALSLLTWMLLDSFLVTVPKSQSQVVDIGVKVGDWAKYGNISATWDSTFVEPDEEHVELNKTLWFKNEVIDIIDTVIFSRQTTQFKNDTQKSSVFFLDVYDGGANATSLFYITSGLRAYDALYPGGAVSLWINETIPRIYAGAMRETNHLNLWATQPTDEDPPKIIQFSTSFYWDKETGVLTARSGAGIYFDQEGNQIASWTRSDEIVETNLWSPGEEPSDNQGEQADIFPYAVAGMIAVTIIGVGVWLLRSRKRKRRKRKSRVRR